MKPTAVLIGPPAAGKTKIGKTVAKMLGLPFVDTDSRLIELHGPIADIFATHGESTFRDWERTEVVKALAEPGIVSLGGGAIENLETQHDLKDHRVVLVTVSADAVEERIDNAKRPLLNGIETWKSLVARRMPVYRELANFEIDTSRGPMASHAERLARELGHPS